MLLDALDSIYNAPPSFLKIYYNLFRVYNYFYNLIFFNYYIFNNNNFIIF